ncbi:MAG: GNAT family N-acetyltransferase [Desulfobacula sp.]
MEIVQINIQKAKDLLKEFERYEASLYPAETKYPDSMESLTNQNVVFYGAMEDELLLGVGALEGFKGYGEIKGVFIIEAHRGKGLAKSIMLALERHLIDQSVRYAKLEIGILQYEALGLYRRLGYKECHAFGTYHPDPLSVFMTKALK